MDLDAAVDTLYALPRDEFTSAREAAAKQARAAGDKELAAAIGRLRRPTVAAWLVNNLARQRSDELAALAELGESLRAAHEQLDGAALRQLSERRRELVAGLTRTTRELGKAAGEPVSEAVGRELEGMFTAALADPDAARVLASGRLSSPKELDSAATLNWPAVAPGARPTPAPSAAPARSSVPDAAGRATEARTGVAEAEPPAGPSPALLRAHAELDRLTAALEAAQRRADTARHEYESAVTEERAASQAVTEMRAQLAAAEQAEQRARQQVRTARRERDDLDRALREATRRHAVARERLSALES
jgi:hypothetical protein